MTARHRRDDVTPKRSALVMTTTGPGVGAGGCVGITRAWVAAGGATQRAPAAVPATTTRAVAEAGVRPGAALGDGSSGATRFRQSVAAGVAARAGSARAAASTAST